MKKKVGFIGLGIMGRPMVRNLLKAGFEVTVFDVVEAAVKEMAEAGAKVAASGKELAGNADVVITMVPSGNIVRSVLTAPDGVLAGLPAGKVVIDMSSVRPNESREFAKLVEDAGSKFLDSPVSGGEVGAREGRLALMIGGEEAVLESVRDILEAMSGAITLVGPNGSGSVTKLANQVIVNLNIAAVAEALVLATKGGADPKKVYEAIRTGSAGSTMLDEKAPMMYERNFKAGGPIRINLKDINNVMMSAQEMDVPLLLSAQLQQIFKSLHATGHVEEDHSSIVKFYEGIADVEVKKKS